MLYYCAFTWHQGTTRQKVAERLVRQHEAGLNYPERIKGWYNLAGGGSGFLLVVLAQAANPLLFFAEIDEMKKQTEGVAYTPCFRETQPIHFTFLRLQELGIQGLPDLFR